MKTGIKSLLFFLLALTILMPLIVFSMGHPLGSGLSASSEKGFYVNIPHVSLSLISPSIVLDTSRKLGLAGRLVSDDGLERNATLTPWTQGDDGDRLVLGGTFILEDGDILDGNLFILGGTANLATGSLVRENVFLIGGSMEANGTINGDVVVLGGLLELGPTAVVDGDVAALAGNLKFNSGAEIYGEVIKGLEGPLSITVPGGVQIPFLGLRNLPYIRIHTSLFFDGLWLLFRSFMLAALAVLAVLFFPSQIERTGGVAAKQAPVSGGVGCLTVVLLPFVLFITAITIIGIPVAFIVVLLFAVVALFGVIAIGTETGKRLGKMFKQDWALAVSAGLGTFLVALVMEGLGMLGSCLGAVVYALVVIVGVGAVLLTRFGTNDYPTYVSPEKPLNHDDESRPGSEMQAQPFSSKREEAAETNDTSISTATAGLEETASQTTEDDTA